MNMAALTRNSRELELLGRVRAGDRESFYKLVKPYEKAIFTSAMSILRNEADAEEVSQQAVLRAFCGLPRFRGECKFSTWLIQITINESRAKLRKDRRSLYESIDDHRQDQEGPRSRKDFADWREIPSEEFQRKELGEVLESALDSLPLSYREVLLLRDVQDLSTEETAKVLGVTEGCIKTRLLRARLRMRDALTPDVGPSWMNERREFGGVRPFVE
jgi:RNA polymerase sigma-70 factor, ECF subfamily